jgi:hypothetical protein
MREEKVRVQTDGTVGGRTVEHLRRWMADDAPSFSRMAHTLLHSELHGSACPVVNSSFAVPNFLNFFWGAAYADIFNL